MTKYRKGLQRTAWDNKGPQQTAYDFKLGSHFVKRYTNPSPSCCTKEIIIVIIIIVHALPV